MKSSGIFAVFFFMLFVFGGAVMAFSPPKIQVKQPQQVQEWDKSLPTGWYIAKIGEDYRWVTSDGRMTSFSQPTYDEAIKDAQLYIMYHASKSKVKGNI